MKRAIPLLGMPPSRRYRVLMLGAGVQSTTLALLSGDEIPPYDFAVFCDVGIEPHAVYAHLDRLDAMVPYPILRVSAGNLGDAIRGGVHPLPLFVGAAGESRATGMLKRQCTKTYKIEPGFKAVRRAIAPGVRQLHVRDGNPWVDQSLGISTDEAQRMKPSPVKWARTVYPLIDLDMSRQDCMAYLGARGVDAPRSACVICPYRSDAEWRRVMADPMDRLLAVELDAALRKHEKGHLRWFHRGLRPLAETDFTDRQLGLWGEECEGVCGF